MPVQIQLRNGTAAQWTAANPTLAAGEVGIESDTKKQKFGDGTTAWNSLGYAGTVTSVTGTSPVASSGGATPAISLASGYGDTQNPYASKTANQVLAAPNGTAGVPSFRALVSADIPTLNQNTTGTAAGLSATLAVASGGTGQTTANTAFNALAPSQTSNSGKYLTTDGTNTSWATVSGGGSPGGTNTQVQYNSSGSFAGSANLTFNGTTLTAAGLAGPLNGTVGATTPATGSFTTLAASSTVSGTGFSTYLASPPAIGGTAAAAGTFTTGSFSSTVHRGATSGTVTMTAPAVAGTQSYTLPTALPTASGQVLSATTAGVMSWTSTLPVASISVEYLVLAGGGGGVGGNNTIGGAGGGGGYRSSISGESSGGGASAETALSLSLSTAYTVTVGAGGPGGAGNTAATQGFNSVFATVTSTGGGAGGIQSATLGQGGTGGSGGGSGYQFTSAGGLGTTNQGYAGGAGGLSPAGANNAAGGGGGAGGVGQTAQGSGGSAGTGGNGGAGVSSSVTGSAVTRGGGGGGGAYGVSGQAAGTGTDGGGNGNNAGNGSAGATNRGGGGGGASNSSSVSGGNGGSGVVFIKIPSANSATFSGGVTSSVATVGAYKIYTVTATSTTSETVTFS